MLEKIGTPISQSIQGDKVFHVRDEGYVSNDPRARGPSSSKRLTFHSDRCDVIGFLCFQPAKQGGENQIVSSVAAVPADERRKARFAGSSAAAILVQATQCRLR